METATIPSPPIDPLSPLLSSPIVPPKPARVPIKAQKKQLKHSDHASSKIDGIAKPKQSKSRNGCTTCKAKRLKCDESKPSCVQCQRRNVICGGYKKDFKWRAFEESTFTTKPIPSPNPPTATIASWPISDRPMASATTSLTAINSIPQDASFAPHHPDVLEDTVLSGLATPPDSCRCYSQSSISPDAPLPHHVYPTAMHPAPHDMIEFEHYDLAHESFHFELDPTIDCDISNALLDDSITLRTKTTTTTTTATSSNMSESTSPQHMERCLPALDSAGADAFHAQQPRTHCNAFDSGAILSIEVSRQDDQVEEIIRPAEFGNDSPILWPVPPSPQSSSSSAESSFDFNTIYSLPRLSSRSPEMLLLRFDQQTCGILSVKDGPTENPWRTIIWPLAQDSPALYHALVSMTAFHTSKNKSKMRVEGLVHMRQSFKYLGEGIRDGSIRVDAALATTLALAFSESWDRHISTGIQHLRGAKAMVKSALADSAKNFLTQGELTRLGFLCSTWVYMDVIARLTSVEDDDSNDFEYALYASIGSLDQQQKIDPLMGCAATLFPLIGHVANLIRRVRKIPRNTINIISQANDLKTAVEAWDAPGCFEAPEDHTSDIQHSLDTAEAYRWATLLYLHQAVPEIPSIPAEELARKVIVYLLKVPMSSRAVIIQIYPLLAAGCEMTGNEDRAWVEDRWAGMMRRMLIGNIDRCWEVVKEVWDRRDADESEQARSALRMVPSPRSKRQSPHGQSVRERPPRHFPRIPPHGLKRRCSEMIEDLDEERTVRGRLHWVGVMKDWNWEVLLG
ncbi:MAG: hypothetical protein Q9182_003850 [Xanthomendoza sp. 2 TL-2023]